MADTLGLDEDDPNMQTLEDLPEIDGLPLEAEPPAAFAALPELQTLPLPAAPLPAFAPAAFAPAASPFASFAPPPAAPLPSFTPPPAAPLPSFAAPAHAAAPAYTPPAPVAAASLEASLGGDDMFSAKDLLGGEDFDLPPPPSGGGSQAMVSKPMGGFNAPPAPAKPMMSPLGPIGSPVSAAPAAASAPSLLGGVPAPSFGAFKNPAPAFKPPAPFGSAAPATSAMTGSAPQAGLAKPDAAFSLAEVGQAANWAEVRQALTAPQAPSKLGGDAGMLALHLCRALVKKGMISVDELLADAEQK